MELILNALWFVIAVGSYALLLRRLMCSGAERRQGPRQWQCIIALGCALSILFPVISLTDDLHDMQATVEDPSSSGAIMKKSGDRLQSTPVCTSHQLFCVDSSFHPTIYLAAFGKTTDQPTLHPAAQLRSITPGRAPPSFA